MSRVCEVIKVYYGEPGRPVDYCIDTVPVVETGYPRRDDVINECLRYIYAHDADFQHLSSLVFTDDGLHVCRVRRGTWRGISHGYVNVAELYDEDPGCYCCCNICYT